MTSEKKPKRTGRLSHVSKYAVRRKFSDGFIAIILELRQQFFRITVKIRIPGYLVQFCRFGHTVRICRVRVV